MALTNYFYFFGCSWTWGKYINFPSDFNIPNISNTAFEKEQADTYSYRALIANHFNARQTNYAEGGSSNDRQFRFAAEEFIGPNKKRPALKNKSIDQLAEENYNKIKGSDWPLFPKTETDPRLPAEIVTEIKNIESNQSLIEYYYTLQQPIEQKTYVLWFITSTFRKEFFNELTKSYDNMMLSNNNCNSFQKLFTVNYYNHEHELEKTAQQMVLWNNYFNSKGITNIWIDTFNHHEYPIDIANRLTFDSGWSDIMTNLCISTGCVPRPKETHLSNQQIDDSRSKHLVDIGLLNPKTLHPTQQGHARIADMLIPKLEKIIDIVN